MAGREAFLAALRPPPAGAAPRFEAGWLAGDGRREPFLAYREAIDVNWSPQLEALHEEAGRDHFLDVATRGALLAAVSGCAGEERTIVDLGCSTGFLLEDLRAAHPTTFLVGIDLIAEGLRKAHRNVPESALLLADVLELPCGDGSADAVVSANLLEHVRDDDAALTEIHRVLRPGGRAALVVPAGPGLYDYYDRFLGHERRYRRGELGARARAAGFEVVQETFLGSLIYPAFWLVKKRNRARHHGASRAEVEQLVQRDIDRTRDSRPAALAARLEGRLLAHGRGLPFGIRGLTVLRRPEGA